MEISSKQGDQMRLLSLIITLLMMFWAIGCGSRVFVFKRTNSSTLWKYRYRFTRTRKPHIWIWFCLSRQNFVTFNQVLYSHIVILAMCPLSTAILITFKNLDPQLSFWIVHLLHVGKIVIPNICIPTFWFLSAYWNYQALWSKRNTIFSNKVNHPNFQIIGNWKPSGALSKGIIYMILTDCS